MLQCVQSNCLFPDLNAKYWCISVIGEGTCQKLGAIQHGYARPLDCQENSQRIGIRCSVACDFGYFINGTDVKYVCNYDGRWIPNEGSIACKSKEVFIYIIKF